MLTTRKPALRALLRIVFVALMCTTLPGGCFQSHDRLREQYLELADRDSIVVVYYGEEISGGNWLMRTGIDFGEVLAPHLEEVLGAKVIWLDSSDYEITLRQGLFNIQDDVISLLPDAVFLRFGLADAAIAGLTEDNYRGQIDELFTRFDDFGIMPVVFTTTGFRDADPKRDSLYKRVNEFNEITMWVAGVHRFPLIDIGGHMDTLLLKNPDMYRSLFSDQTHFNDAGMEYIADFIMKNIRSAVGDMTAE